jgi:hypothetical protein
MLRAFAVTIECGRELRAVELNVDELTAEFDGEDVLKPDIRERLGSAMASLREMHERVQRYTGPFELAEPDEELRATLERIVDERWRTT